MKTVSFTQMKDGTKEDYEFLTAHEIDHTKHTADRLLTAPGGAERVQPMKCWFSNHKSAVFLRKIEALKPVMHAALFGDLTPRRFYALYRDRRRLPWYRGSLAKYFAGNGREAMAERATAAFRANLRRQGRIGADRSP